MPRVLFQPAGASAYFMGGAVVYTRPAGEAHGTLAVFINGEAAIQLQGLAPVLEMGADQVQLPGDGRQVGLAAGHQRVGVGGLAGDELAVLDGDPAPARAELGDLNVGIEKGAGTREAGKLNK